MTPGRRDTPAPAQLLPFKRGEMYQLAKRLLFRLEPERAHEWTLRALGLASRSELALRTLATTKAAFDARLRREVFGLTFPNPIGLAAGLDKDGVAVPGFAAFGFGALELGSVTALAQPGNPRPRLLRLPEEEALINRMGLNNRSAHVGQPLGQRRRAAVVEAHAVDQRLFLRQPQESWSRVARLRERRHAAQLERAEAESREARNGHAVLVEAGGKADGVGERKAEHLAP